MDGRRARAFTVSLCLCAWAIAAGPAPRSFGEEPLRAAPALAAAPDATPREERLPVRGATPGSEKTRGSFVPRRDMKSFYAASGGRLWYYLNLYYWAPEGMDPGAYAEPRSLWIKAVVVERFSGLTKWPDATPVANPEAKTTVEYWAVGPTGRAVRLDNHKDFWMEERDLCAGTIDVTMTLTLGRVRVTAKDGSWEKPAVHYVLDRKSYEPRAGLGEGNIRFEPLSGEPVNEWGYAIAWSQCPGRFVKSNWEGMRVPDLVLRKSETVAPRATPPPVTTPGPGAENE